MGYCTKNECVMMKILEAFTLCDHSFHKQPRIGALSKTLMGAMGSTVSLNSDVDGAEVEDRYQ